MKIFAKTKVKTQSLSKDWNWSMFYLKRYCLSPRLGRRLALRCSPEKVRSNSSIPGCYKQSFLHGPGATHHKSQTYKYLLNSYYPK